MANSLVTLEQIHAEINSAIPVMAAEMKLSPKDFVAELYVQLNAVMKGDHGK